MERIYVCNTGSDSISSINLVDLSSSSIIIKNNGDPVGPHGICLWNDYLLTANNYNNSLSKISIKDSKLTDYYIGAHCNDVKTYNQLAYIVCGEGNSILVFDLEKEKIISEIPSGSSPHSIEINQLTGLGVVANMESDCITVIDCNDNKALLSYRVGEYPLKAMFSQNGQYIYVNESKMGSEERGSLRIVRVDNQLSSEKVITVGKCPVDFCLDEEKQVSYVTNFGEGSISIVHLSKGEIKKILVGGMPRGIIKVKNSIFVGDNLGNRVLKIDINKKIIIPVGKEPNGMTYYRDKSVIN